MESVVREGSLGNILLKSNIITEADIKSALAAQLQSGKRFGEELVNLGIVTQEDIDWALSNQLDIPYVRLKTGMIDPEAVGLVSAELARQYNLIPLIRSGDELNVALSDPLNGAAIEAVEQATGCQVRVSVALIREIREMLDHFFGPQLEAVSFGYSSTSFSPRILEIINEDATGGRFLNYLLAYFIQNRLSGLSLQPLGDSVSVLARRGGVSRGIGQVAITHYREFLLNLRKMARNAAHQEACSRSIYQYNFRGACYAFQVLMLRGEGGDFVTFKLDLSAAFPETLEALGLTGERAEAFKKMTTGGGLVVVTHRDQYQRRQLIELLLSEMETGGKSIIALGAESGHVAARFPRVACHGGLHGDCHSLVLSALEHDPDILTVEDATEPQTFITCSKAAMHGKLVIAGLDFRDMGATLRHLLYFRHKHYVIPAHIRGIVTCRRLSLLCRECRQPHTLSAEDATALGASIPPGDYFKASGCPECGLTGYSGVRYLVDMINFDKGLVEVFEGATDGREILRYLSDQGYSGTVEEGLELLKSGDISAEEYVTSILL